MDAAAMLSLLENHFAPWTQEDLDALPKEWRVEIIDGTLIVHGNPLTFDDWKPGELDLFSDSTRFEIIDGLLYVNAQPNPLHQLVADRLRNALEGQAAKDLVVVREIGVTVAASTVGPDISVVKREKIRWTSNEQAADAVLLVVEVASPTTQRTDRLVKAEKYAEAGIPGYWRVELDPITVIAYALREGAYAELGSWTAGETVEVDEPVRVRFDPATLLP